MRRCLLHTRSVEVFSALWAALALSVDYVLGRYTGASDWFSSRRCQKISEAAGLWGFRTLPAAHTLRIPDIIGGLHLPQFILSSLSLSLVYQESVTCTCVYSQWMCTKDSNITRSRLTDLPRIFHNVRKFNSVRKYRQPTSSTDLKHSAPRYSSCHIIFRGGWNSSV